jgi:hypothetical protein
VLGTYFPLIFLVPLGALVLGTVALFVMLLRKMRRQAREFGYPSLGAYLRAAPRTDLEKQAATDLALKGLVVCLLGLIFPPLLVIGLFPFFYGARKVAYASMGLGLVDDASR